MGYLNSDLLLFLIILFSALLVSIAIDFIRPLSIPENLYGVLASVSATLIALPLIAAPIIGDALHKFYMSISNKPLEQLGVNELMIKNIYKRGWGLYILQISIIYVVLPAFLLLGASTLIHVLSIECIYTSIIILWLLLVLLVCIAVFILMMYRVIGLIEKARKTK